MYGQGGHLLPCIVASCIANRQKAGWGNWLEILDKMPVYAAEKDQPTGTPDLLHPTFMRLLHEIEGIYDGSLDYAKGGVYFCDLRTVETDFFKEHVLGRRPKVVDMNSFAVFK